MLAYIEDNPDAFDEAVMDKLTYKIFRNIVEIIDHDRNGGIDAEQILFTVIFDDSDDQVQISSYDLVDCVYGESMDKECEYMKTHGANDKNLKQAIVKEGAANKDTEVFDEQECEKSKELFDYKLELKELAFIPE